MITLRRIQIRPNTEVEFFPESAEYETTLEQFTVEGKIISVEDTLSEDQLTKTKLITFADDDVFLLWRHHPNIVSWIRERKKYDYQTSIVTDIDFL